MCVRACVCVCVCVRVSGGATIMRMHTRTPTEPALDLRGAAGSRLRRVRLRHAEVRSPARQAVLPKKNSAETNPRKQSKIK